MDEKCSVLSYLVNILKLIWKSYLYKFKAKYEKLNFRL